MVKRTLPDEQRKVPDDESSDEVELQTMERAEELSSQFEAIKDRTVDDDMVLGQLKDIETSSTNSKVIVTIDLPGEGMDMEKRFDKPKVWSNRYKFVRWIRHYDYDADSFPLMLDDECKVKVVRDGNREYKLFIPEEPAPMTKDVMAFKDGVLERSQPTIKWYLRHENGIVGPMIFFSWMAYGIALLSGLTTLPLAAEPLTGLWIIGVLGILIVWWLEETLVLGDDDTSHSTY